MAVSMSSISADESVLLMHFVDHIFPLEYPMYKPGILQGGRGWLLALCLRTKPLYHAALAISAYHRRMTMPPETSQPSRVAALVQQEKHLGICLSAAHQAAQSPHPSCGLGIATTVSQLVFLEVLFNLQGFQAVVY